MKEDNCSVALSSLFNVSSKMPVLKRCSRMNLLSERARDQARDTVHKVCESPSALFSPTPRARQNRVAALVALQLANRHATLLLARSPDTVNCALRLRRRRAWNSLLLRCFGLSSSSSSVGHSAPVADKEERERESDQTSGESSANKSERPSLYSLLQYFPSSLSLGCSLPPSFLPSSFTPDGEENAATASARNANFPPSLHCRSSSSSSLFPLLILLFLFLTPPPPPPRLLPVVKLDFPTSSLAAAPFACVSPMQKLALRFLALALLLPSLHPPPIRPLCRLSPRSTVRCLSLSNKCRKSLPFRTSSFLPSTLLPLLAEDTAPSFSGRCDARANITSGRPLLSSDPSHHSFHSIPLRGGHKRKVTSVRSPRIMDAARRVGGTNGRSEREGMGKISAPPSPPTQLPSSKLRKERRGEERGVQVLNAAAAAAVGDVEQLFLELLRREENCVGGGKWSLLLLLLLLLPLLYL